MSGWSTIGSAFAALAILLVPTAALACPQCAGRSDGGIAQGVVLTIFVLFPFVVAGTVMKIIKREEVEAPPSRRSPS
jgi:hypothetical protein